MAAATSEEFVPSWQVVKNVDAFDIPAHAVVEVTEDFADNGALCVKRPTAANLTAVMVVNGGGIPAGGEGMATFNLPVAVLCDADDDPPESGQSWGTKADSFMLGLAKSGFTAVLPIFEGLGIFKAETGVGDEIDIGLVDEEDVSEDGLCFGADLQEWNGPLPTDHENGEKVWFQPL